MLPSHTTSEKGTVPFFEGLTLSKRGLSPFLAAAAFAAGTLCPRMIGAGKAGAVFVADQGVFS